MRRQGGKKREGREEGGRPARTDDRRGDFYPSCGYFRVIKSFEVCVRKERQAARRQRKEVCPLMPRALPLPLLFLACFG